MSPKFAAFLTQFLTNIATACGTLAAADTFPKFTALLAGASSTIAAGLAMWHAPQPPKKDAQAELKTHMDGA